MINYTVLDDQELMHLLKADDRTAFTVIFKKYWQSLYTRANSILENPAASKDIVQEVFFSIWNRRYDLELQSVKGYLEQATRFQVFKAIRDRKAGARLQVKLAEVTADILQDDFFVFKEHEQLLDHIISRLPEDCREAFRLSRKDQLTYKEIAALLNIPEKVIERRIAKCLSFLRTHYRYEIGIWLLFMDHFQPFSCS